MTPANPAGLPRVWRPAPTETTTRGLRVTWRQLDHHWALIEADLHERFGIDLWAPGVLDRPWPWLRSRIGALLATPPNLVPAITRDGFTLRRAPATRIQLALAPDDD